MTDGIRCSIRRVAFAAGLLACGTAAAVLVTAALVFASISTW